MKKVKYSKKEKTAYACGYAQAFRDCFESTTCIKDRTALSILVEPKAIIQLLNPKEIC